MTATVAKPAKVRTLDYDSLSGMLRLTVGKSVEAYSVFVLPVAGVTQVALHKFAATDETRYIVTINGEFGRCTCPAGRHDKLCKHVSATRVLISRGLLTAAE